MPLPKLSLQVLEAFEQVAHSGSVQTAASEMGLSISTVSHHVARLEEELGVKLLDRSTRPFALTREGRDALHHLKLGLQHLRQATSETGIAGLLGTRSLKIGFVEDFESNLAPELAVMLAGRMPKAKLSISNVLSHAAPDLLRRGELDLAIASTPISGVQDLSLYPLVRDPFIMVGPRGETADLLGDQSKLPFLRFNPTHQIGRQVEAHLSRHRITLPERYNFDTVQSIMAVVANGDGWSIITPLGYARGLRFENRVQIQPLPVAPFARRISLIARSDFDAQTSQTIAALVRARIQSVIVDPIVGAHPWLDDAFSMLGDA
ncbi:LysR family transcriptional regulator [Roseibium polysiphoniae]|uniref:LysR family transcriptional regulator n=1 Tax=Roseibium polysiphoniae TaxID=2571221 RepID=UPI00329A743B